MILMFRDPDRLQSEEYRIRLRELKLLYRTRRSPEVIEAANEVARIESSVSRSDTGGQK
jgi:hypothetical protein